MKKILIPLALFIAIIIAVPPFVLGFSIWHLGSAVEVATGLGAKIACSARFVTGLSEDNAFADVVSYSPAAGLLDLTYDYEQKTVHAELFGLAPKTAKYRDGLGCTLEVGDTAQLDRVQARVQPSGVAINEAPWPKGQTVNTLQENVQNRVEALLSSDNQQGYQTRALLVVKGDQIIAEAYAPGLDHTTALMGWSMGKSVTAMLIGRQELLTNSPTAQLTEFEAWQNDERKNINLVQLLQMSSGLDFDETYAPGSDATHMLFSAHSASDVAMTSALHKTPGSYFSYSSGTTNLLARWLYEQLGGTPQALVDFTYNELFAPLGMAHTVFEPDASGVFVGSSYIYASARDWARLGLLMKNGGEIQGQRLLSEDWVKRAAMPNTSNNDKRYGYQFWLNSGEDSLRWESLPADAYAMQGNRSQRVMMIPSEDMVIVRLGWSANGYPTEENFSQIISAVQAQ